MVKYDPENPLSDKELDELAEKDFEMFLEYLDGKTAYLKQFTKPLDAYHLKRFAAQAKKDSTGEVVSFAKAKLEVDGHEILCEGEGNGPVNALDNAIRKNVNKLEKYSE